MTWLGLSYNIDAQIMLIKNVFGFSLLITIKLVLPADQVDLHLLRCQQLRLYILKAARALLSHQDKLRQILCQPAVVDIAPNTGGMSSSSNTIIAQL